MERFEMPTQPETERIARLAAAALRLEKTVDLKRSPDGHVYAALDAEQIRDLPTRKKLVGKIKAEIARRRPTPLSERQDLIEDARRASELHPDDDGIEN
jgi:hypothetical protein